MDGAAVSDMEQAPNEDPRRSVETAEHVVVAAAAAAASLSSQEQHHPSLSPQAVVEESSDEMPIAVAPSPASSGTIDPNLASTAADATVNAGPAEIPPEPPNNIPSSSAEVAPEMDTTIVAVDNDNINTNDNASSSEEEDDYEYEDEDDAPFVSGFLVDNPAIAASRSMDSTTGVAAASSNSGNNNHQPATIRDEDDSDGGVGGGGSSGSGAAAVSVAAASETTSKPKWREPSRQAVNMSLRAEKETSGGKRRLAQDLYRIMNQDTAKAGFSLEPSAEDSMDKWSIKLFQFDADSNLAKDMLVLGLEHVELEMSFPDQYPFEPPFVRVVRPRFKRQTGFVMNGALCMELLTKDGWNPINDIESVIVSVRSLLVVGDGRLEAAYNLSETKYNALLAASEETAKEQHQSAAAAESAEAHRRQDDDDSDNENDKLDDKKSSSGSKRQRKNSVGESRRTGSSSSSSSLRDKGGSYSAGEASAAYSHLSDYHKKKGWDSSGWWKRKG